LRHVFADNAVKNLYHYKAVFKSW